MSHLRASGLLCRGYCAMSLSGETYQSRNEIPVVPPIHTRLPHHDARSHSRPQLSLEALHENSDSISLHFIPEACKYPECGCELRDRLGARPRPEINPLSNFILLPSCGVSLFFSPSDNAAKKTSQVMYGQL